MRALFFLILLTITADSFAGSYFTIEDGVIHMIDRKKTHQISDFSTDGCSSFPDGFIPTQSTEWLDCCIIHDIDYWIGGEEHLKDTADENLGFCVADKAHPLLGLSMDIGVQIGGVPSPASWRWGYGWEAIIGYNPIDEVQLRSAASKLDTVIDAIIKEKVLLSKEQRLKIAVKLESKAMELFEHLENNKKGIDAISEYRRLSNRVKTELLND